MTKISPNQLISIWERTPRAHPIDAVIAILDVSGYGEPDAVARLPLGVRDAALLTVRASTLGDRAEACDRCPSCGLDVEVRIACSALLEEISNPPDSWIVTVAGADIPVRPLNSLDAAAAAAASDPSAGRMILFRCATGRVASPTDSGETDAVVIAVGESIIANDPLAEILLAFDCPACDASWTNVLDVASFVSSELRRHAEQLLNDVDTLARAYGWSEADVLAQSDARRAAYVAKAVG
jgi:hypothetical protein